MSNLSFPQNPSTGTWWPNPPINGSPVWIYDGEKWIISAQAGVTYGRKDGIQEPVLPLSGGTMTGTLRITCFAPQLILNRATADQNTMMGFRRQNLERWQVHIGAITESGGNTGSDFYIQRFGDNGGFLGAPVIISRQHGNLTTENITVSGTWESGDASTLQMRKVNNIHNVIQGVTNGYLRWQLFIGNYEPEPGGNFGSNFTAVRFGDDGGPLAEAMHISRQSGTVTFGPGGTLNIPGAEDFAVQALGSKEMYATNLYYSWLFQCYPASVTPVACYTICVPGEASQLRFHVMGTEFYFLEQGGYAFRPGGGNWLAASDVRIKNIDVEYGSGLAQIEKLNPVVYTFRGNDTEANGLSPHASLANSGKEFVGFIAQDMEDIMPEMITKMPGYIDGKKVDDIRLLDSGPLMFAMINAVKELSSAIERLEAR